jgi:phospholipase C
MTSPAASPGARAVGERPFPDRPEGTDTLPQIDHILVLMMENHTYDNWLGMLGRGPGQQPRGDGFTIGPNGRPTASNPTSDGQTQHAFPMPTTCQLTGQPTQEWAQSHIQFNDGRNDGFVKSGSGPVAMGYWTGADLPWSYSLATTFALGDHVPPPAAFANPPTLAAPLAGPAQLAGEKTGPGQMPPPGSVTPG